MADFNPDDLLDKPPPVAASMKIRPRLSREEAEKLVTKYNPDIKPGAVAGEVDNIMRESGGKPDVPGDYEHGHATSGGLYQDHNTRLEGLKQFASKEKADWADPEIQVRYARLEKERDYPSLLKLQQTNDDRTANEDAFKRIFERPASVLWGNDATGRPVLGNDRYRFSDSALKEHPEDSLHYMRPQDYLDLSPALSGNPFSNAAGRSLMRSFNRGDEIESVPTLETSVNGPTATVTEQDGRHRALLAQQEGIEAIPVAIKQTGEGAPSEIQGMSGNVLPHNFPGVAQVQQRQAQQPVPEAPKEPISLLGEIGNAIVPSAQAAEPEVPAWARQAPSEQNDVPAWAKEAPPGAEPDSALLSTAKGAAAGLGNTVLAGQELLGKGLEAAGAQAPGQWLVNDARKGMANLSQEMAPDAAAHPFATGAGDFLGGMVVPAIATGGIGNALARGATAGAAAGALQPGDQNDYWANKALQTGVGAGAGAAGNKLAGLVAPTLKAAVGKLMQEGVQLTPGQMAGGAVKRAEDAMASIPILGSAIRSAQRRSIETFNRAAVNRSLSDIGAKMPPNIVSGHDAIEFARDEFSRAYNQVLPNMTGSRDPAFMSDLNDIMLRARQKNLPGEYLDQLQHILQNEIVDRFDASGRITGDVAQKVGTQLDALTKPMQIAPNPYIQDLGRFVREGDNALDNMMAAHNPTMQAAKDRIDAGYAKFKTVQRAATALGAHDGTFTPAQLKSAIRARDRSKDKAAFSTGDAMLQDLAIAAQDVLPQKVPDSGTPERAALMGLLGGAAHFEPHAAVTLAGLAVPYTTPVSRAANWAVNRLSQQPGPARNMLAGALRFTLPPAAGEAVSPSAPQQANTLRSMMPMQQ